MEAERKKLIVLHKIREVWFISSSSARRASAGPEDPAGEEQGTPCARIEPADRGDVAVVRFLLC